MVGEIQINDMKKYNASMTKSMIDKMFFMDKIDDNIKVICDYGCADGALIRFLAPLFPDMLFIGYDLDEHMIEIAQNETNCMHNVYFFSKFEDMMNLLATAEIDIGECAINLSSLIHEVYSYCTEDDVAAFWNFVNKTGFKYIIIRDMCLDESAHRPALKEDLIKVRSHYSIDRIHEFEKIHGSISDNYNLIHFLLKYRYVNNWDREVHENYLPLSTEGIASKVGPQYELIYFDHYVLPFLARSVKNDFDVIIKDYTHVKAIYQLKA